jgi:hypothetical protein
MRVKWSQRGEDWVGEADGLRIEAHYSLSWAREIGWCIKDATGKKLVRASTDTMNMERVKRLATAMLMSLRRG